MPLSLETFPILRPVCDVKTAAPALYWLACLMHPVRHLVSAYLCLWVRDVSLADSVQQSDVSASVAHSYPMPSVAYVSVSTLLFPYVSRVFFVPASLTAFHL